MAEPAVSGLPQVNPPGRPSPIGSRLIRKLLTDPVPANGAHRAPAPADRPLRGARVIVFLGSLELGGAERQALHLARALAHDEQADVRVLAFMGPGQAAKLCDEYRIPWRVLPLPPLPWPESRPRRIAWLRRVARLLREERPDILLPYTIYPNVACGLIWRRTGARLCIWNQRDEGLICVGRIWERWAAANTPALVANSQGGVDFLRGELLAPAEKVHLIRNGVVLAPPKADRRAWRERLGLDEGRPAAVMLASMTAYKDHETPVRAWQRVRWHPSLADRRPVLLFAGRTGDALDSLKLLAFNGALSSDCVRFLGKVDDVPGLLSACDMGLLCSPCEGSPNAILECMAAGLPVAGSDIPGIREAVGPAGLRFLAPPGDAGALADRVIQILLDPELRAEVGAANQQRIADEYSVRQMCERMRALMLSETPAYE